MQKRIINQSYTYIPGGMANISATFQILSDTGEVLTERGISCQCELDRSDFQAQVANALAIQAQEHVDQFLVVAGLVFSKFPTCQSFDEALGVIVDDTLSRIVIGG